MHSGLKITNGCWCFSINASFMLDTSLQLCKRSNVPKDVFAGSKGKGSKSRREIFIHKHNNRTKINHLQALCLQSDAMPWMSQHLHLPKLLRSRGMLRKRKWNRSRFPSETEGDGMAVCWERWAYY